MNFVSFLQNFIYPRTSPLPDIQSEFIRFGGHGCNLGYMHKVPGGSDPLRLNLNTGKKTYSIEFDPEEDLAAQYIKPVGVSPFYLSYMISETREFRIIDFFSWDPVYSFYRIVVSRRFGFKYPENAVSADFSEFPVNQNTGSTLYLYYSGFNLHERTDGYVLRSGPVDYDLNMVILSEYKIPESDLNFARLIDRFKKLITISEQNSIFNFLSHFEQKRESGLISMWRKQLAIKPDLSVDRAILLKPQEYTEIVVWCTFLAVYLKCDMVLKQLYKASAGVRQNSRLHFISLYIAGVLDHEYPLEVDPAYVRDAFGKLCRWFSTQNPKIIPGEDDFFWFAYFTNYFPITEIRTKLQTWWECYSQPVFRYKLQKSIDEDPEPFFLITLLALRFRLPWIDLLIQRCGRFEKWPLFALLLELNRRLCKVHTWASRFEFSPGSDFQGQKISLRNGNLLLSFASFGKTTYTRLESDSGQILKIDKPVCMQVDLAENMIRIKSSAPISDKYKPAELNMRVAQNSLRIPVLWRKAELVFYGVRLRWIQKKERLQLTVSGSGGNESCEINDQPVMSPYKARQVISIDLNKTQAGMEMKSLSVSGNTVHILKRSAQREVWLHGYAWNQYGILTDKLNYKTMTYQKIIESPAGYSFNSKIKIPNSVREITISQKRFSQKLVLREWPGIASEAWMRYDSLSRENEFVVILDENITGRISEIRTHIRNLFAFEPVYMAQSELEGKIAGGFILYLVPGSSSFGEKRDLKLTNHPFIMSGIEFFLKKSDPLGLYLALLDS